jgi:His-Xaa-Ser system radical SAM maturase HxsC
MIPLTLGARSEASRPFVARVRCNGSDSGNADARLIAEVDGESAFASEQGLFALATRGLSVDGDILLVDPERGAAERILRADSRHNTLLVTERCDQLCVMCSQPPKKTHVDRFQYFREACLLAPKGMLIGVSGGEPTLYKQELFELIEEVLEARSDLAFHVLSNGQHFDAGDIERLRNPIYRRVAWGVPLYSAEPDIHDEVVAKTGAFERLEQSFEVLLNAGARIELRTVVMKSTVPGLARLAERIAARLSFIESWSIMQLENIGFAKNRWGRLHYDHSAEFSPIAGALDVAQLHGINGRLFNFPLCTVPHNYRHLAPPSISDWKRKYAPACGSCRVQDQCSGFFEWHPEAGLMDKVSPL